MIDWSVQQDSDFVSLVRSQDYQGFVQFLESASPSKLDVEIKCYPSDEKDLDQFFKMIITALNSNQYFELIQTVLQCFLRAHGDVLKNLNLDSMAQVKDLAIIKSEKLESKLLYGLCLLDFCLAN